MKLDDVVTNENSRTVDRIRNINKQVSINNAMLHPYGFFDKIGTWYDSEDTYGQTIKYVAKCEKDGEDVKTKVYIRPAWWANENSRKAGKVEEEMVESDYDFWFNEEGQLTYKFLRGKKLEDAEGFAIKYLNDPTQAHRIKFPRELLIRRTIASNMLPQQGMIVTTVDTAYSTKSWADYTVILTSLIYGGRFYVIDMKRGRYNEFELPQLIAQNALQWKPKRICIEDSVGVKWLGREVYREMDRLKLRVPIEFVPLGQGNKSNAKNMKAKPVLRLLGDERLLFANQCVGLEELYTELEKFDTAAATHDDIVSALSILVDQFASYAEMEGRMSSVAPDFISDPKMKQQYDHIYGAGVFEKMLNQKAFEASLEHQDMSMSDAMKAEREASGEYYDPLEAAGLW
jgi:predicted phage terminase large subunit-like protein